MPDGAPAVIPELGPSRTPDAPAKRAWLRDAGVVALFVVLSMIALYPMPLQLGTHLKDAGDPLEYAWVLGYSAHRLMTSPLDLYNGNILHPFALSLAYSDSTIASTLTLLPLILATDNTVLATNVFTLLSFVLAGVGTYLFVRSISGSRSAGVLAGVIFAFNPYRMDHLSQIPNIAVHWMPFVFLAMTHLLRGRSRWWAFAAFAFLTLQLLSSLYYAFVLSVALGVYLVAWAVFRPRRVLAVALPLGLALVGAYAVLIVTSLPYFEVSRIYGMKRTLVEAQSFSARPTDYLSVAPSNQTWARTGLTARFGDGERHLFPGLVAIAVATFALLVKRTRPFAWAFFAVAGTAFLVSLGPNPQVRGSAPPMSLPFPSPYQILYDVVPGFQSMRVPPRFAISVMLAMSVLAGLGWAGIANRWKTARRGRLVRLAFPFLVGLAFLEYASFPISMVRIPTGSEVPAVYRWLGSQPEKSTIVELPIDATYNQALYEYFSNYHGWKLVNGWRSFLPPGYETLVHYLQTFPSRDSLSLLDDLGVRYVVMHTDRLQVDDVRTKHGRLARYADRVKLVRSFEGDEVYEITAGKSDSSTSVSLSTPCTLTTGSAMDTVLTLYKPGVSVVAWPVAPVSSELSATWTSPSGEGSTQRISYDIKTPINLGAARIPLRLIAPDSPGRYSLVVAPSPGSNAAVDFSPIARTIQVGAPTDQLPLADGDGQLRLAQFDRVQLATTVESGVAVRSTWATSGQSAPPSRVFVNVFDSQSRYWSIGPLDGPENHDLGVACSGEQSDMQVVRLRPDTPPGYYSVEIGILDPASGTRRTFLDRDLRAVDKVAVGQIRVSPREPKESEDVVPQHAQLARFGQSLEMLGWTAPPQTLRPGSDFRFTTYWDTVATPDRDYSIFVHLYDADGRLVAQSDGPPGGGAWPTSRWQADDAIDEERSIHLPESLASGSYTLMVGVYDPNTATRLPITLASDAGDQRLIITQLTVE